MRLTCPICGDRDLREFAYLGTRQPRRAPGAGRSVRPCLPAANPAGPHAELWHHRAGCAAWLEVTRDTRTHAVHAVRLAGEGGA